MKHPHAELFIAIANGEGHDNFECAGKEWKRWEAAGDWIAGIERFPQTWQVRRKAKTIKVNNFDVPAPCRVMPSRGELYAPSAITDEFFAYVGEGQQPTLAASNALMRGVLHSSKEAAAAHGKALLGIDPSK